MVKGNIVIPVTEDTDIVVSSPNRASDEFPPFFCCVEFYFLGYNTT
jgi:hypothetical protein